VVLISYPFKGIPSLPLDTVFASQPPESKENIHKALASLPEPRKHYKYYYSTAAAAPDMDGEGLHDFLRRYFYLKSADWDGNDPHPLKTWEAKELAKLPYYYVMPLNSGMRESVLHSMASTDFNLSAPSSTSWLSDEDLAVYVDAWKRNGFQGGLNWYRVSTDPDTGKDLELFAGRKIDVPSLFISGKKDWGTYQEPGAVENMVNGTSCSNLKGVELVDGAGHWVQQEQPEKVIELLSKFLKGVKVDAVSY